MAEQPKYFDIEDTETGKKYRIETDDPKATYDEAVEYFSSLPEADWAQYEYNPQAITTPAPEVAAEPAAPVAAPRAGSVSLEGQVTDEQAREIAARAGKGKFGDVQLAVDSLADPDYMANQMTEQQQRQYLALANNPNVTREQLTAFTRSIGRDVPDDVWASIDAQRKTGNPFQAVASDYQQKLEELVPEWATTTEGMFATGPEGDDWLSQIGRGWMGEGQQGSSGILGRTFADWLDVGGDNIDRMFPDLTPDERENLQSAYAAYLQRNVREDNEAASANDSFIPWLIGAALQPDASDLLGLKPAKLASVVGRVSGKGLELGGASAIADIGYQAADIQGGVQDEFDITRTGVAGLTGAALGTAGQGVAEIAPGIKTVNKASAPPVAGRIVMPEQLMATKRNAKKYKEELDEAATQMVAHVNDFTQGWTNVPDIEVHNDFSKLEGVDNSAIGVYTEKTLEDGSKVPVVLINAEAVLNRARARDISPESVVEAVTFHEALAHHGLTSLFRNDLDKFLDDIYTNGSEQFRDKVDEWMKKNPRAYESYGPQSRRILATEEVMAEWSEGGPLARTFYDSVANYIKDFARTRLGMNLKYTEREVKAFLAVAHERTMSGTKIGATPSAPRNMPWHGSPHDFPPTERNPLGEFDHSKMGSGEGNQYFGWGSYLTDLRKIAEAQYRDRLSGAKPVFRGVEYSSPYHLRRSIKEFAGPRMPRLSDDVDMNTAMADNLLDNYVAFKPEGEPSDQIIADFYDDFPDTWGEQGWSEQGSREFILKVKPLFDILDREFKLKTTGKLYEVTVPDNAKWLEWENSVESQPDLKKVLDEEGIEVPAGRNGELAYRLLAEKLTPKGASLRLAEAGFAGNRYLADSLRQNKARKNDGTDVFNYVVFQEKDATIINKYMRGDDPIDPDQLTADDLIEAQNALDILNRLNYTPKVVTPDQLEAEAIARNLPPSDVTRLVGMEPGKLMKKLFLYDVAATKLSDRAAKIKADIDANGLTPERQAAYIETTMTLNDLTSRIFDFQAEIGRTLAANRRVNFSRKRVRDLKSVLEKYGVEALADPETFMKYMAEMEAKSAKKEGKAQFGTGFAQYVNIPRAIMSSADLSAPLRQGIVFIGYKEYWKSFAKMFSMLGKSGEGNYNFLMKKIARDPNYELMLKARLQFSSLDGELTLREEDFQTELARKIPLYGRVVKGSEQAYAGFLNKLRADMFNRFVKEYQDAGIELDEDLLKGLGRFINAGTGRAELPEFLKPSSTVLNATFFSARLMHSRVQMLNPLFYKNLPAPVRKQAGKAMLKFGGIALLVNGALNALFPEVETEVDPRSSDFMKVKVGNTRFDLGGGFNQYLILGARTGTWLYNQSLGFVERNSGVDMTDYKVANKKTIGGDYRDFGAEGMTQDTYGSVLADFFRSKLSPQASYVVDFLNESDYIGRPFTVEGSLASRLVPMTASSVYEAYAEDSPVPMPLIFTATLFGVGTNTYTAPGLDPKRELEAPLTFDMSDLEDGQNDFIRAEGGVVTLKKPARDAWTATLNNYYPVFIQEVSGEMGLKFEEMDDEMKKATVKEALKRTRAAAKKDMMYELGLE